jgi:hypothetical protein
MVCETRIDIADIDKHDQADLVCVDCLFIRSPVTIWCIRLGHGLVVQRVVEKVGWKLIVGEYLCGIETAAGGER